jgi:flagellar basal-body rod protein FlgB
MIASGLFATPGIQGLSLSLDEAALRQQAISSNIANINTPGYQRVDVSSSFENAVQSALSDLSKGDPVGQMPTASITTASQQGPARPDGNTVQLESEMLGLAQNSAKYEFASEMMANSFHGMKTAITGNVN